MNVFGFFVSRKRRRERKVKYAIISSLGLSVFTGKHLILSRCPLPEKDKYQRAYSQQVRIIQMT